VCRTLPGIPELTALVVNCCRSWIRRAAVQEKEGLASGQSTETGAGGAPCISPRYFALLQKRYLSVQPGFFSGQSNLAAGGVFF
jgi:hypothetical protein